LQGLSPNLRGQVLDLLNDCTVCNGDTELNDSNGSTDRQTQPEPTAGAKIAGTVPEPERAGAGSA
jgi:hypothetical protein